MRTLLFVHTQLHLYLNYLREVPTFSYEWYLDGIYMLLNPLVIPQDITYHGLLLAVWLKFCTNNPTNVTLTLLIPQ